MEPTHKALRDEVRLLGELLVKRSSDAGTWGSSRPSNASDAGARGPRGDDRGFPPARAGTVPAAGRCGAAAGARVRPFLNLANVAEQHHASAVGVPTCASRTRLRSAGPARRHSSAWSRGREAGTLHEAVRTLRIELVLTAHRPKCHAHAHPQVQPDCRAPVAARAARLDASRARGRGGRAARRDPGRWDTDEVRHQRTSRSTRCAAAWWCSSKASGRRAALRAQRRSCAAGRDGPSARSRAGPVRFGSWIGGDRDGNLNVTPEISRQTCMINRWAAASSSSGKGRAARRAVDDRRHQKLRDRVGDAREPYRELLREVRSRLAATRAWAEASLNAGADVPAPAEVYLGSESLAARSGCAMTHWWPPATRSSRPATDRRPAPGGGVRRGARAARHPPGSQPPHRCTRRDYRALGLGRTRTGRGAPRRVPRARAGQSPSAGARRTHGLAGGPRRARHLRGDRAIHPESLGAYVITMAQQASDVLRWCCCRRRRGSRRP